MYEEDSNLESMLNNPFQNLSSGKAIVRRPVPPVAPAAFPEKIEVREVPDVERPRERTPDAVSRVERNHPLELRMLNMEKDVIIAAKRMDDMKRIIEQQNERIQLLEDELDILRAALGKEGE